MTTTSSSAKRTRRPRRFRTGTWMAWYRYYAEAWTILPAARWLPRRAGYALGMGIGLVDSLTGMGRLSRTQLASSHHLRGRALWAASWRWCATPYVDLLHLNRCARGVADDTSISGARVRVPAAVAEHVRSGRSLVVVGGHFPFAPSMAAVESLRRIRSEAGHDGPIVIIVGQRSEDRRNGGVLRDQLRSDAFHGAFPDRPGTSPVTIVEVQRGRMLSTGRELLTAIRQPGALCFVALDRPWDAAASHRRPFAGWAELALSTNAARLAIAGGAGMVSITPKRAGTVSDVTWGELHDAAGATSAEALTDACADEIEDAIGRWPMDYQLSTGFGRSWDATSNSWRSKQRDSAVIPSRAAEHTARPETSAVA